MQQMETKVFKLFRFKKALNETYEWFKEEKNLSKYTNIQKYNI